MRNLKAIIAYQGTTYLGWQKTRMGLSIEEVLQKTLEQILQHPIKLQAASRTDAGVHAKGQVVNFFTSHPIELRKLHHALLGLLPPDISVLFLEEKEPSFHPTLDCIGKEYHYYLCYGKVQLPFDRLTCWHYPYPLDIQEMKKASLSLIGKHDFSAFSNERTDDAIREIFSLELFSKSIERLQISITGNNFLYKMVRNLVGTLVYVGCGKLKEGDIPKILESKERSLAGVTAPACGLFLEKVLYVE